jgi:sigma-B regulation protein RsbU (phosphoserine phosphatase)
MSRPSDTASARRSVLVVDDEPGMRYAARRILAPRYEVVESPSGEEAIDRLGERRFDIALVDVRLPGLTGLELLATIKVMSPSTDVVIMTGSVKDPDEALLGSIRRKAFFFLRKPFSAAVLETLVDRITETQILEERVRRHARRLEEDLESARIFQQALLPPRDWKAPGIEVAGLYVPSARLSGDLIDYWSLPDGQRVLLVADVMGHGASAAMMTGIVKTQIRTLAAEDPSPAAILRELDARLHGLALASFLTILLVVDNPARGEIVYAGAGHPAGILLDPKGPATPLRSETPPLNLPLPDRAQPVELRLPRQAGSRLFLFTDGFSDALSPRGEPFQESPRYHEIVQEALTLPPAEARARLEETLSGFTGDAAQDDDRAFLVATLS